LAVKHSTNGQNFGDLVPSAQYAFNPTAGSTVTIPLSGRVADVQLRTTSNTGAPGGQVAEFQNLTSTSTITVNP
jgi:hypothetical protein